MVEGLGFQALHHGHSAEVTSARGAQKPCHIASAPCFAKNQEPLQLHRHQTYASGFKLQTGFLALRSSNSMHIHTATNLLLI